MTISEKIHQLRIEKDLTQSQLAKIAGVSDKAVSAWELGTRDPKLKFIQNICVHFGLDIHSFVDESVGLSEKAPTQEGERKPSDEEIKFALFGGDGEITDAMYDEVKRFAQMVKLREEAEKRKG